MENRQGTQWYRLDNAANIYPVINDRRRSSIFRLAVLLNDRIDPTVLQEAVNHVMPRFPTFCVRIQKGLFWYYFLYNPHSPLVQPEAGNPCMRFRWHENNGCLVRVFYYQNRISVEFFHALTDGTGGIIFLKTLLGEYLRIKESLQIVYSQGVLDCSEKPSAGELENAFARYAAGRAPDPAHPSAAYHVQGTPEPHHTLHITSGEVSVQALLEKARENKSTITEYLSAVLVQAFSTHQLDQSYAKIRPVIISVPVNLRKLFPSNTVRNFSHYLHVGVNPIYGQYAFEETLYQVRHSLRYQLNKRFLQAQFTRNVRLVRNPLVRIIPLFLKRPLMMAGYIRQGERLNSCTLSNLGTVTLPDEMLPHVRRFEFLLGPLYLNRVNCTVVSFGDRMVITLSSTLYESDIERLFFCQLVEQGLPVKLESNRC